ncbi:MAG: branched-chain amino acid ABC transporter permease [Paludibacteraceae bacterium]|nr:branched-chain amino acid ABC transporter permease [Paludibacteraceae bacterium]
MEYIFHIIIMLNIYIMLTLSANLTIGMANLLTMCQAAFYGIGAYIGTYFLMQFNLPFVAIAALVMLLTGLFSILISFASVRLKGDYFVIATMGFQLIVYTILYNWTDVTRGPYGIPGIPSIKLFGVFELSGIYAYLVLSLIVMGIVVYLFHHLVKSPFGRTLNAIRADEIMVESMGRNTVMQKSWAFFLSAAVAGLAGVIYASYVSYIDPTSFTLDESIFIISALFIGGIGNTKGPVLGALFVVLLPELLRFVGLPDSIAANLRQIIYGLALILVMYYRSQGLWGKAILK